MRGLPILQRRVVLCTAVLLSPFLADSGVPQGQQDSPKKQAPQKAATQDKAPRTKQPSTKKPGTRQQAPGKRTQPKTGQASSLRAREERRAKNHISVAFPRTRSLLGYLERRDRQLLDTVLGHSQKITRRLESEALSMARQHHPELARLVNRLRRKYPRAYQTAIRDLVSDHQRIQRAKTRGEDYHDIALTEWKLRSQARLIAAQMTQQNLPALSKQLEAVLTQEEAAKRRQIQLEIRRYQQQIKRLQSRLKQDPEKSVRKQLNRFQRQAQARAKTDKRRRK